MYVCETGERPQGNEGSDEVPRCTSAKHLRHGKCEIRMVNFVPPSKASKSSGFRGLKGERGTNWCGVFSAFFL